MWNHTHSFKDLDRFFVGFDKVAEKVANIADQSVKLATNYPPYNIKKIDDNKYVIEMAVAGFGKNELEIEIADDKLIVKGNHTDDGSGPQYLYQGLAMRPFTRTFNLADNVEIQGASLFNGILKIALEAIIPEHKKPKKIDIDDNEIYEGGAASTKEFLAERKEK